MSGQNVVEDSFPPKIKLEIVDGELLVSANPEYLAETPQQQQEVQHAIEDFVRSYKYKVEYTEAGLVIRLFTSEGEPVPIEIPTQTPPPIVQPLRPLPPQPLHIYTEYEMSWNDEMPSTSQFNPFLSSTLPSTSSNPITVAPTQPAQFLLAQKNGQYYTIRNPLYLVQHQQQLGMPSTSQLHSSSLPSNLLSTSSNPSNNAYTKYDVDGKVYHEVLVKEEDLPLYPDALVIVNHPEVPYVYATLDNTSPSPDNNESSDEVESQSDEDEKQQEGTSRNQSTRKEWSCLSKKCTEMKQQLTKERDAYASKESVQNAIGFGCAVRMLVGACNEADPTTSYVLQGEKESKRDQVKKESEFAAGLVKDLLSENNLPDEVVSETFADDLLSSLDIDQDKRPTSTEAEWQLSFCQLAEVILQQKESQEQLQMLQEYDPSDVQHVQQSAIVPQATETNSQELYEGCKKCRYTIKWLRTICEVLSGLENINAEIGLKHATLLLVTALGKKKKVDIRRNAEPTVINEKDRQFAREMVYGLLTKTAIPSQYKSNAFTLSLIKYKKFVTNVQCQMTNEEEKLAVILAYQQRKQPNKQMNRKKLLRESTVATSLSVNTSSSAANAAAAAAARTSDETQQNQSNPVQKSPRETIKRKQENEADPPGPSTKR